MGTRGGVNIKVFDEVEGGKTLMYIYDTGFGPLMEAIRNDFCEESHRRTINNIEVDG